MDDKQKARAFEKLCRFLHDLVDEGTEEQARVTHQIITMTDLPSPRELGMLDDDDY